MGALTPTTLPVWLRGRRGDGDGGYGGYGGYGDGDGGYGDGYGDGYGGYGYGDDGYGYGDGDGDGGYGGYGDGAGDGCDDEAFWLAAVKNFSSKWPEAQRKRLALLRRQGATIAYWRSDNAGRPANGGTAHPVEPGVVQEVPGPLQLCSARALHATFLPSRWSGDRIWIVALLGDVEHSADKIGALKREIIGECV